MINNHTINSVLNNTSQAFNTIVNFYDPYRNRNRKPCVLDITHSYYWSDNIKNYKVIKTNNMNGTAKDRKYDIIIYEPPKNKNFNNSIETYLPRFSGLLYNHGIIIIKVSNFHINGTMKGEFEIQSILHSSGFSLIDNIVCKNKLHYTNFMDENVNLNHSDIVHSNFMIFKPI